MKIYEKPFDKIYEGRRNNYADDEDDWFDEQSTYGCEDSFL